MIIIGTIADAQILERFMPFDWNEFKREYDHFLMLLKPMPNAPSERQVDVHMVMRKLEQTSVLDTQLDWGYYSCGTNQ